jgi:hypothetical protein
LIFLLHLLILTTLEKKSPTTKNIYFVDGLEKIADKGDVQHKI